MTWRVEKVPSSRTETASFLRAQVERLLRLGHEAKDRLIAAELLTMAAWLHERVKALETRAAAPPNEHHDAP